MTPTISVSATYQLPTYVSFVHGTRLRTEPDQLLLAFLISLVELGGRPTIGEVTDFILPDVPVAVARSVLRSLENSGLVKVDSEYVSITTEGLEAVQSGDVPIQEVGFWRLVWTTFKGSVMVVSCARDDSSPQRVRSAIMGTGTRSEVSLASLPSAKKRRLSGQLLTTWFSPLEDRNFRMCLLECPSTVEGVAREEHLLIRMKVETDRVLAGFGSDDDLEAVPFPQGVLGSLVECTREPLAGTTNRDVIGATNDEIVSLTTSGLSHDHTELNDGVTRTSLHWAGLPWTIAAEQRTDWIAHFIACALDTVLGETEAKQLLGVALNMLQLSLDEEEMPDTESIMAAIVQRYGRGSEKWWLARAGIDWGLP